jgi:hypothetical protein
MSGVEAGMEGPDRGPLYRLSLVAFWVAYPVIAVSTIVIRSGQSSLFWVVIQDCGLVVGDLALLVLAYFYLQRRWSRRT